MLDTLAAALISALVISAVSFAGAATFFLSADRMKKVMPLLLSLAAGAMLGNAVLHMLPHALEGAEHNHSVATGDADHHDHDGHDHHHDHDSPPPGPSNNEHGHDHHGLFVMGLLLVGFFVLFGMDLVLLSIGKGDDTEGVKPLGYLVLLSDGLENFMDGIVIGAAYLVSFPVGLATSIAVLIHEIPMELGDFAVLTHSGFSRRKALLLNLASALVNTLGVGLAVVLGSAITGFATVAAPLAAGAFLYLAATGLLPHIRVQGNASQKAACFAMTLLGVVLMALILLLE